MKRKEKAVWSILWFIVTWRKFYKIQEIVRNWFSLIENLLFNFFLRLKTCRKITIVWLILLMFSRKKLMGMGYVYLRILKQSWLFCNYIFFVLKIKKKLRERKPAKKDISKLENEQTRKRNFLKKGIISGILLSVFSVVYYKVE